MKKNTIVITDFDGAVGHRFCTEQEGKAIIEAAAARRSAGTLFTNGEEMDAEIIYDVSPNFREKVERAKEKLRFDLRVRDALDKHGVPDEPDLRKSVYAAVKELTGFNS